MKKMYFLLFVITSILTPLYASSVELLAHTEMFILMHKEEMLYVRTLNLKENNFGWIEYDIKNPNGKIFTSNLIDKLSVPTASLKDAFYLVLSEKARLILDRKPLEGRNGEKLKKYMEQNTYSSFLNFLPLSNRNVEDRADDLYNACPVVPKRKNGSYCHQVKAYSLQHSLIKLIKKKAKKIGVDSSLLASIIQHESLYNPFIENLHEKKMCLKQPEKCSDYKWGKGLSQLGKTDAYYFGLNWDLEVPAPSACKKSKSLLNKDCFSALKKSCRKYRKRKLKPVNCPGAAIEAVARKIKSLIPEDVPVWLNSDKRTYLFNLSPHLRRNRAEMMRNYVALYNRGVKTFNSYVEYYDQFGTLPDTFGKAWATPRLSITPSASMGYQMLTKEYISRCYVYAVAGLCDEMPDNSLIKQYDRIILSGK